MRATKSKDGKHRITLNVSYRMDAEMLATLITAEEAPDGEPAAFAAAMIKKGERALLNIAREEIDRHGIEVPYYRVGDGNKVDHRDTLAAALRTKFGLD